MSPDSVLSSKKRARTLVLLAAAIAVVVACRGEEVDGDRAAIPAWPHTNLVSVEWLSEDLAIVVGEGGEIHRTSDAGDSWARAHVPPDARLRAISMADDRRGWAVGDGVILRTDDGGLRWRRERLPRPSTVLTLTGVRALSGNSAIVVGEGDIVLRWRDASGSWEDLSSSPVAESERAFQMSQIDCLPGPDHRCWSAGLGLSRTDDGGESWEPVEIEDYARTEPIDFDSGQVELAEADRERLQIFAARNRSRSQLDWIIEPMVSSRERDSIGRRQDPSALFELIAARLLEVRAILEEGFVSPTRIVAIGGPPWDYEETLDEDPRFLERYFEEREAPASRLHIRLRGSVNLDSISIGPSGVGLAVGAAGAVIRSEDAGANWQSSIPPTTHDLYAVAVGRRRAVVVGAQGGLWTSADGGQRWKSPQADVELQSFDALRAIAFSPSGEVGMVVGDQGRMLLSRDGGESWTDLVPPVADAPAGG